MTTQEIDNLNYDQAVSAVRAAGHKGTWIASAKSDILKKVLKGEITYPAVAEAMGLPWSDPFGVWAKG